MVLVQEFDSLLEGNSTWSFSQYHTERVRLGMDHVVRIDFYSWRSIVFCMLTLCFLHS